MHARGKTFEPERQEPHPSAQPRLQEAGVLPGPHPLPHEAGGLRPGRRPGLHRPGRPQHPEPGRQQVRAHQLGRGARHRHRRDAPHQGDVRADRHPLPVRPARREQDGPRPARLRAQAAATSSAATPCRCATPTAGKAGAGAPSTCGAASRSASRCRRRTCSTTSPRTPNSSSSGAATRRPPPGAGSGQLASRLSYWWTELGIKQIYIAPDCNYAQRGARRQVDPRPAQHRRRPLSGHRPPVVQERHLRQGVPRRPTPTASTSSRTTSWAGEDGVPKSPEWAAPITGVPARTIKALADEWASKRTTVVIGNGGPGIRGPYATEPARLQVLCLAMQGLGKPGCNQAKMIEWGLHHDAEQQCRRRRPRCSPACYAGLHAAAPPSDERNPTSSPRAWCPRPSSRAQVDWYGNGDGVRAPARTSSSTTSIRPTAAPRST